MQPIYRLTYGIALDRLNFLILIFQTRRMQEFGMIIGLDVGGTHTDAILLNKGGVVRTVKVPTDLHELFDTILQAIEKTISGIDPKTIHRAVLSTTLATNMVVQKQFPPAGMVVTAGPGIDPECFRTNEHYYTVSGAMDHSGREIEALNRQQVQGIGETFKTQGIRFAGVVSKFSVRNPGHENTMAELLAPYVEHVFKGHTCSGSLNFPRRIATTYLNTTVYPVHKAFYEAVEQSLSQKGLTVPIRILKPDGGNINVAASLDYPAQTILSGPSASVMGALAYASKTCTSLVLDIGGTTTDMAVLIDGAPLLAPLGIEIPPFKTLIRALQTHSMGVGGDSAVRISGNKLSIGPDRMGKAMAYGGPAPTPTDAFCVLGMSQDGDQQSAERGIASIAEVLGIPVDQAARKIFETACRSILDGARAMIDRINQKPVYTVHELWEGSQVRPQEILVLGGPAPQFAAQLSRMFQGRVRVVPHWQVANAIGCALARTTTELTLFADTTKNIITVPGERYSADASSHFELEDARQMALELLRKKAVRRGAGTTGRLMAEIIEASEFNMVRGFHTMGKNIRVRAQIKPGLIEGYDITPSRAEEPEPDRQKETPC
jgi:N-methylhydantoinase A/oxoprolinase/acetone carboxylase beta subunit